MPPGSALTSAAWPPHQDAAAAPLSTDERRVRNQTLSTVPSGCRREPRASGRRRRPRYRTVLRPDRRPGRSADRPSFERSDRSEIMRAVVITKHGDLSVLQTQERPDPPPPSAGQVTDRGPRRRCELRRSPCARRPLPRRTETALRGRIRGVGNDRGRRRRSRPRPRRRTGLRRNPIRRIRRNRQRARRRTRCRSRTR